MIDGNGLRFVWLEITGRCQLSCSHCYARSGPAGSHGRMTMNDWLRVIDQAAGLGVDWVQFIGGTDSASEVGVVDRARQEPWIEGRGVL